jgi:hypothetical protein
MRDKMKKFLLAFILLICFSGVANAQSTLALQEKCAEGAKKFFLHHINLYGGSWGNFRDEKGRGYNHFTSHYNKKLDKCLIQIDYYYFPKDERERVIRSIEIFDAFEGTIRGSFFAGVYPLLICEVGNKKCNSLEEFKALIKPFMEE